MGISNAQSGTRIDEIADRIYRVSTPVPPSVIPGGFTFDQFLIIDEAPLLFHMGLRKLFPLVSEAVAFSHVEADECGSLNQWLTAAPEAAPLCERVAASVSIEDLADRMPREIADGEKLSLAHHEVQWFDAPHLPHAWECGFLAESRTRTLFCGDLFTQPADNVQPMTQADILGPSETFRTRMDYFSYTKNARALIEKLASTGPTTLACMHGSAWSGDGAVALRALADVLTK
jgi:flavorubredoxin